MFGLWFRDRQPRGEGNPTIAMMSRKRYIEKGISRISTEHLILALLIYPHLMLWTEGINPSVADIAYALRFYFGRERSTAQIRRLLCALEIKGIIKRELNAWHTARYGNTAQATRYVVIDLKQAYALLLSNRDVKVVMEARAKEPTAVPPLPVDFSSKDYVPGQAYTENYGPFYRAAKRADLAPRFPKGDPRNMERLTHNISSLTALKLIRQKELTLKCKRKQP